MSAKRVPAIRYRKPKLTVLAEAFCQEMAANPLVRPSANYLAVSKATSRQGAYNQAARLMKKQVVVDRIVEIREQMCKHVAITKTEIVGVLAAQIRDEKLSPHDRRAAIKDIIPFLNLDKDEYATIPKELTIRVVNGHDEAQIEPLTLEVINDVDNNEQ